MKSDFPIILILISLILSACEGRPSWVLPEKKMENVLFDIHIAEAAIEQDYQTFNENEARKQELYNAVFEKHHITAAQFDTSMTWYSTNLKQYIKIYENLEKRYIQLGDTLTKENAHYLELTAGASFVNVWHGRTSCFLRKPSMMENTFTFRLDSADFKPGDTYELRFDALGLSDSLTTAQVMFYAFVSDTIFTEQMTFRHNGHCMLSLSLKAEQQITSLSGSIQIRDDRPDVCVAINRFGVYQRKSSVTPDEKPVYNTNLLRQNL